VISTKTTANAENQLLPHQLAFVDHCVRPDIGNVFLHAAPGLGKSAALIGLVSRVLREKPDARVLLVSPSALRSQFLQRFNALQVPAAEVDRYTLRAMIDQAGNTEIWTRGRTWLLSWEFIIKADVLGLVAKENWDLVIFDEAHFLPDSRRAEVVKIMDVSSVRVVLASVTPAPDQISTILPSLNASIVPWDPDAIVDLAGQRIVAPPPRLEEIEYTVTPPEKKYYSLVNQLHAKMGLLKEVTTLPQTVLNALSSSPAALESRLQGFVSAPMPLADSDVTSDEAEDAALGATSLDRQQLPPECECLALEALAELDICQTDSKLAAFLSVLKRRMGKTPIWVLTDYLATSYYLAAAIEAQGIYCRMAHGGISDSDRDALLRQPNDERSVVIATNAFFRSRLSIDPTFNVILYDVPKSADSQLRLLSSMRRMGSHTPQTIYALVQSEPPSSESKHRFLALLQLSPNAKNS
jgi:superfamily II DNA or RNA helicase